MNWPDGYAFRPDLGAETGRYRLRPIQWSDRQLIRGWRNEQIDVLRQANPLTAPEQDRYFREVLAPQLEAAVPPVQVIFGFLEDGHLVGYGGVVHIDWPDQRGEVSFLTAPERLDDEQFASDWTVYLDMLVPLCRDQLGLVKLTTEAYATRTRLFPLLERAGFAHEGTLRDHHAWAGHRLDSVLHGLMLQPSDTSD